LVTFGKIAYLAIPVRPFSRFLGSGQIVTVYYDPFYKPYTFKPF